MTSTTHVLTLLFALAAPLAAQDGRGDDRGSQVGVWSLLAERYDANRDGRITAAEYPRGRSKFVGYDTDADGVLTRSDFEGAGSMDFGRMLLGRTLAGADQDGDGDIRPAEWRAYLASLGAAEDGVIPPAKLPGPGAGPGAGRRGGGRSASLDRDGDGSVELSDLALVHALIDLDGDGTLGRHELAGRPSREAAPTVGERAPDFELAFAGDEERRARLSSFAGKRPVALVFGSYT